MLSCKRKKNTYVYFVLKTAKSDLNCRWLLGGCWYSARISWRTWEPTRNREGTALSCKINLTYLSKSCQIGTTFVAEISFQEMGGDCFSNTVPFAMRWKRSTLSLNGSILTLLMLCGWRGLFGTPLRIKKRFSLMSLTSEASHRCGTQILRQLIDFVRNRLQIGTRYHISTSRN